MSLAKKSLGFSGLFEAELLTSLLLWRWEHPLRDDKEFVNGLLEDAVTALRRAVDGERLLETLPAQETNLVAAIYYAEWNALESGAEDMDAGRRKWLAQLRRSIPSCFCSAEDLPP